jgi:hypothetical protein
MDFILACTLWIIAIGLAVWVGSQFGRIVSAFWRSWQQERLYWRSDPSALGLKRVCGRVKARSLGELRFTRSRAEEFDGPPDHHGE